MGCTQLQRSDKGQQLTANSAQSGIEIKAQIFRDFFFDTVLTINISGFNIVVHHERFVYMYIYTYEGNMPL